MDVGRSGEEEILSSPVSLKVTNVSSVPKALLTVLYLVSEIHIDP